MSVAEDARRMARAAFELRPFWLDPPYELARAYAVPLLRWRHPLRRLVGRARDGQPAAVLMAVTFNDKWRCFLSAMWRIFVARECGRPSGERP
jgi:hypothetical protein